MNKGKEKIIIAVVTILILIGIFIAFIFSNSQKEPGNIIVRNDTGKTIEAVRFGYKWKVFGKEMVADSVNPIEFEYTSTNTLVSKTLETLLITAEDKFELLEAYVYPFNSIEGENADYRENETLNQITIDLPKNEGTYIYVVKLKYAKGEATYGFKVVITEDTVYEAGELIKYKNTQIIDNKGITNILNELSYAKEVNGIIVDDDSKNLQIDLNIEDMQKEDLLNNTVALFVLIPDLDSVTYVLNNGKLENEVYFSREELNNVFGKDILEFSDDTEKWLREVIYGEKDLKVSDEVTAYASLIETMVDKSDKDSLIIKLGDGILQKYDKKDLLNILRENYKNIISTNQIIVDDNSVIVNIAQNTEFPNVINFAVSKNGQIILNKMFIKNETENKISFEEYVKETSQEVAE